MDTYINKLILLLLCSVFMVNTTQGTVMVVALLITITASSLISFFQKESITLCIFVLFLLLCSLFSPFFYYFPVLCYDVFAQKNQRIIALIFLPLILHFNKFQATAVLILLLLTGSSYLMKLHYKNFSTLKKKYYAYRDWSTEANMDLQQKNQALLEKQDYEIHLATLNERNRIAQEIHDNVGHLLSSSILQIGAILATTQEEEKKEALRTVKNTLSTGMDSIRNSIHNIYEDSIDLEAKITTLLDDFTFCKTTFTYQIEQALSLKTNYSLLYIIKEALTNVMKHSNATLVSISLIEHPVFYQLIITDNGTPSALAPKNPSGIGLNSIAERVANSNGYFHLENDSGFRIFITLPKGEQQNEPPNC